MQINVTYDSSVSGAPSGFLTAVQYAVDYLDSVFTSPITVNIDVGWGEVDGQTLSSGDVGESQSTGVLVSYSEFRNDLLSVAVSPTALEAAQDLPTTDSTNGGYIYLSNAEAKALGELPANQSGADGEIGLNSSTSYTFDPNNRSAPGQIDAIAVIEHEMTEVMGRISILGTQQQGGTDIFGPLDVYRYTSPGQLVPTSNAGSFSIDGQTLLKKFNNPSNGGDSGDWTSNATGDAFDAFVDNGRADIVSGVDLTLMQAIGYQTAPVVADFDYDGKSDLLWQGNDGTVAVWEVNGTSLTSYSGIANPGSAWHVVGSGDFSGNGYSDILLQNNDGSIVGWEMNGYNVVADAEVADPGPTWHVMGTGDFTGNGKSDIVWQDNNGTAAIWEMNGLNITSDAVVGSPGSSWHIVGTGDFTGNGLSDILWQNDDGTAAIWEMNGLNVVSYGAIGNQGTSWHVVGAGDFTGDGRSDIVWQNTDGAVAIWEMNGLSVVASATVGNPGSSWQVAGIGDYYGDGMSDILFRNSDGQAELWEMNGLQILNSGNVGPNPGTFWQLQGDGAASYTIGSGFTVPLGGGSAAPTPSPLTVSSADSLTPSHAGAGSFTHGTLAR